MMVAAINSFDLWQKDVFFSAAEEVQESADTMESAYRVWIKEKRQGRSDQLCIELQAALSTAKWQLEEFERAVRLSHHGHCRDDTTLTRHKQFVNAIENQIYRVQSSLQESLAENGKQPLRLVDLNKEERDDLAMFLSGSSSLTSESFSSGGRSTNLRDSSTSSLVENTRGRRETSCVIDIVDEGGSPESADAVIRVQQDADKRSGTRRTWSSPNVPNVTALRINVEEEEEKKTKKRLVFDIEDTPKEKGSKPLFSMQRCRDYNLIFDRVRQYQRRFRVPFSRPVQLILSLTLILFLLLLFRVY